MSHLRSSNDEWGVDVPAHSCACNPDADNFQRRRNEVFNWWGLFIDCRVRIGIIEKVAPVSISADLITASDSITSAKS